MALAFVSGGRHRRKAGTAADLAFQIKAGLKLIAVPEYRFHPTRKWLFDLALVDLKIAIEVEGGLFMVGTGRHNRGAGMRADLVKYSEAVILGWRLLRILPEQINSGAAYTLVDRLVKASMEGQ